MRRRVRFGGHGGAGETGRFGGTRSLQRTLEGSLRRRGRRTFEVLPSGSMTGRPLRWSVGRGGKLREGIERFGARHPCAAVTWRFGASVLDSSITQSKELLPVGFGRPGAPVGSSGLGRCGSRRSLGVGFGPRWRRAGSRRDSRGIAFRHDASVSLRRGGRRSALRRRASGQARFGEAAHRGIIVRAFDFRCRFTRFQAGVSASGREWGRAVRFGGQRGSAKAGASAFGGARRFGAATHGSLAVGRVSGVQQRLAGMVLRRQTSGVTAASAAEASCSAALGRWASRVRPVRGTCRPRVNGSFRFRPRMKPSLMAVVTDAALSRRRDGCPVAARHARSGLGRCGQRSPARLAGAEGCPKRLLRGAWESGQKQAVTAGGQRPQ